jgi:carbonic anhydrase
MILRAWSSISRSFMAHQHSAVSQLLSSNAQWAADVDQMEPTFFKQLAQGQSPKVWKTNCE